MPKEINRFALLLALVFVLAGCVPMISGHRLDESHAPIKKLSHVVLDGKAAPSSPNRELFNANWRDLRALMQQRLPLVFSINGVEPGQDGDTPFVLIIKPTYGLYRHPPFIQTYFSAYIIDKSMLSKKIWEGELIFRNSRTMFNPRTVDERTRQLSARTVDEFARDILKQLAADEVVNLGSGEIKLPAEDELSS